MADLPPQFESPGRESSPSLFIERLEGRVLLDAAIGNLVWNDIDGDGLLGASELGIDGASLNLYLDDGDSLFEGGGEDSLAAPAQLTAGGGNYQFNGLVAGEYWIDVDDNSPPLIGAQLSGGSDPLLVLLASDEQFDAADFGFQYTGTITGTKWIDLDGNQLQDPNEDGLAGWTIFIDQNNNGALDQAERSTVTDGNGDYELPGLPAGTYTVAEVLQTGWQQTFPSTAGQWQPLGQAPILSAQTPGSETVTGRLVSIAPHPTDPDTLYVAGAHGGVWRTTDGGVNWTPLTDDQPTLAMGSIAIAPSDSNIIYAGTGEAHFSADSLYGRGVLKSTDGGDNWTQLAPELDRRTISKVVVDPTDPDIVYAAVARGVNGLAGNKGVWKSIDGGLNWSNTTSSIDTVTSVTDLVMDATNPEVLIAGYGEIFGNSVNGLYRTINGGGQLGSDWCGHITRGCNSGTRQSGNLGRWTVGLRRLK